MSTVFLAFEPRADAEFAVAVKSLLTERGHLVLPDLRRTATADWAIEIEGAIQRCDYFVVLLTRAGALRETIANQFRFARDCAAFAKGTPRLILLLADDVEEVPYGFRTPAVRPEISPLRLHWRQLQRASLDNCWQDLGAGAETIHEQGPPPLALEDDPFYVSRAEDESIMRVLERRGQTIIVRGTHQTGKTSMLARAVRRLLPDRKRLIWLDLNLVDTGTLEDRWQFVTAFFAGWARQSGIQEASKPRDLGSIAKSMTHHMEQTVLRGSREPVCLVLDNADRLFKSPLRQEFFAMLRSWHGRRAFSQEWENLDIVLAAAADPYLFIADVNQSPFNVGLLFQLEDFSPAEVDSLNVRFGQPFFTDDLLSLFGGHPYLTRRALQLTSSGEWSAQRLMDEAASDSGPFADHLHYYVFLLEVQENLTHSFARLLRDGKLEAPEDVARLHATGLIRRASRRVAPRCKLYSDYFQQRLAAARV